MSNVIQLNFAEIDTVVGGTTSIRTAAPPPINYNKTMMAMPNQTYAASNYALDTGYKPDTSALQARLDTLR